MNILEVIKNLLTYFDPQLSGIFKALRVKSPTVYLSAVSLLVGANFYIMEAVKAGTLTLNNTGLFITWCISFVLSILMRPTTAPDVKEISKESDIVL